MQGGVGGWRDEVGAAVAAGEALAYDGGRGDEVGQAPLAAEIGGRAAQGGRCQCWG